MAYYKSTIRKKLALAPAGLGKTLGNEAVRINLSAVRIAKATGATRQTVYNWFFSGQVAPYYRDKVNVVLEIMHNAGTAEQAWGLICAHFNLKV